MTVNRFRRCKRLTRRQRETLKADGFCDVPERELLRVTQATALTRLLIHCGLPLGLSDQEVGLIIRGCNLQRPEQMDAIWRWHLIPGRRIQQLWPSIYFGYS